MKKNQIKKIRPKATPAAALVSIPPCVAALAMFSAPACQQVHDDFRRAWALMPEIVQNLADGTTEAAGVLSPYECACRLFEAAVAESRRATENYDRRLAAYVDELDRVHPDAMGTLEFNLIEPALFTGLALGLFLALGEMAGGK